MTVHSQLPPATQRAHERVADLVAQALEVLTEDLDGDRYRAALMLALCVRGVAVGVEASK